MTLTNEDLLALSGLFDTKLGAMEAKLDDMEARWGARLDAMEARWEARLDAMDAKWEARLDAMDAKWETRLGVMDSRLKRVELRLENDVIPRLQNIEECYVTTYERYRESTASYTAMQADLEIVKKVVMDHSEKLKEMA